MNIVCLTASILTACLYAFLANTAVISKEWMADRYVCLETAAQRVVTSTVN